MEALTQYPQVLSIRGNYAVIYTDTSYIQRKPHNITLTDNFKNIKTYSGQVTSHAQKRIQKAVSILVQRSKMTTVFNPVTNQHQNFKLGFLTLTIPDLTTLDQSFYYKCLLKPYLRTLKNKFGLENYIWKAELQKRGSIHYHLTIDKLIPFYRLRDIWNELLDKNNLMEQYKLVHGNTNPNSIDIHSVKHIDNLTAYLTKYISKRDDSDIRLKGKVWGCSDSISSADYCKIEIDYELKKEIHRSIQSKKVSVLNLEQCAIIRLSKRFNWQSVATKINDKYNKWLDNIIDVVDVVKNNDVVLESVNPPPKFTFAQSAMFN